MSKDNHLITVVGPTAIGKTSLGIKLAQQYVTEIISADSRQFFKEMHIGTAVPSPEELSEAPHHFIQHKSIFDSYSVGDFEKEALQKIDAIFLHNKQAVLVGGSGLYVDSVIKGLDYFPEIDPSVRETLNTKLAKDGIATLQAQLKQLDASHYNKIDVDNPHRLIRALEVCIGSEQPYSSFLNQPKQPRNFTAITIGLTADRAVIYDRINQRVDIMMDNGLLEEAEKLYPHQSLNALQTVGYRELFRYFSGEWTLEFAISEIKKNTRRFAKRQQTWFKKDKTIKWFDYNEDVNTIITNINDTIGLK